MVGGGAGRGEGEFPKVVGAKLGKALNVHPPPPQELGIYPVPWVPKQEVGGFEVKLTHGLLR